MVSTTAAASPVAEGGVAESVIADAPAEALAAKGAVAESFLIEPTAATPVIEPAPAIDAAAPSPAGLASSTVDEPIPEIATSPAAEPLSRRARRATQPIVMPDIAPMAPAEPPRDVPAFQTEIRPTPHPAPRVEAVLSPAVPFELLEPVLDMADTAPVPIASLFPGQPVSSASPASAPATESAASTAADGAQPVEAAADAFVESARLFSFTGETPVQRTDEADQKSEPGRVREHKAPRRSRAAGGTAFTRVATASFSVGIMGVVGLLTVGMTTPAEAVAAASGVDNSMMSIVAPGDVEDVAADEIQAYVAPATSEADTLQRSENYATASMAEIASEAGITNFSNLFVNDPNAAIQWPFSVGVTMSYGYGWRSGRMHEGIDFTPGNGAPIQAIAAGTVRVASEAGGAYGVHVIIDHVVDGQLISSHYAHMQYGSLQVVAGQKVSVGTVLGRTGNTGRSYGAHTHFELLMNGTTPIDPWPWLQENAGRSSLG